MPSINKVFILGHVGQDPTVKYTSNGKPVAIFNVATTDRWKDKSGQPQQKTTWHRVIAWGRIAEAVDDTIRKGSLVYIEGKMNNNDYINDQGVKQKSTQVVVKNIAVLDGWVQNFETEGV